MGRSIKARKRSVKKTYIIAVILCYFIAVIIDFAVHTTSAKEITQGISEKIIRLHVLANSDADYDQKLKLKVKDAIVTNMKDKFEKVSTKDEARELIYEQMDNMKRIAKEVIAKEGYDYDVSIYLGNCMFPTKVYGDMTFPAGEYEALRIDIGKAEGKNWWCVMFPPLCFVDGTYSVVPDSSKKELQNMLTDKEYSSLFTDDDVEVKIRFRFLDDIIKFFS